ncbi:MAG: exonuclease domain-containing protein [Candidatus Izemoplasma sp.]|nr:exonuclease domain-containing protein [Candidatus Izemoplasma sp.]
MVITGRIYAINPDDRIIAIKHKRAIRYYYIQRSLFSDMAKYLTPNRFVQFKIYDDQTRVRSGVKVETIDHFIRIMSIRKRENIVYYDTRKHKHETRDLLNNLDYKCFLDLEMSMHPYYVDKTFVQEVIQVGYLLVDKNDNVIQRYETMVKPTRHKSITKRTKKFLNITQEDVNKGISFHEFYEHFEAMLNEYNPAIFIWGKNDYLALRDGYRVNDLPSLKPVTRYINLLQLHKNYFHLQNDIGLFNCLKLYQNIKRQQVHDALEDAKATFDIYKGFKRVLNGKLRMNLKR